MEANNAAFCPDFRNSEHSQSLRPRAVAFSMPHLIAQKRLSMDPDW